MSGKTETVLKSWFAGREENIWDYYECDSGRLGPGPVAARMLISEPRSRALSALVPRRLDKGVVWGELVLSRDKHLRFVIVICRNLCCLLRCVAKRRRRHSTPLPG